ncbi:MAG: hypothetical protein IJY20_05380 [Clostridia bacterium]|nr:hypothetical protein [Clostridia bacterium]
MKPNKELLHNKHYFERSELMNLVALGLMLAAAISYVVGRGLISYLLLAFGLPLGAFLFIYNSITRSNEKDLDEYISRMTEDLGLTVENDKHFEKKMQARLEKHTVSGYEYREGVMLRQDKSGKLRSSLFTKTRLYPFREALCVNSRTISLVEEEKSEWTEEIAFSEILSLHIQEEERSLFFGKKSFTVKDIRLVIERAGGETISLPMREDLELNEFLDTLNKQIAKSKQ